MEKYKVGTKESSPKDQAISRDYLHPQSLLLEAVDELPS